MVSIPISIIETHEDLSSLRGKDPDVVLLTKSIASTGGDSLYCISLYVEIDSDSVVHYYVGDGHQRLRSLQANGVSSTFAQVVLRWRDSRDAAEDSLAANTVRYQVTDVDLYSIVRQGKIPREKIKSLTGFSDSKLDRIYSVAPYPWLCIWVDKECVSQAEAATWVLGCKKSPQKLEAIQNSLQPLIDKAEEVAEHYRNTNKRIPLKGEDKKKMKTGFNFKAQHAKLAQQLVDAAHAGELEKDGTGTWRAVEPSAQIAAASVDVIIGPSIEWESNLALSNFFGRAAEDVPAASYQEVLAHWNDIGNWVRSHAEKKGVKVGDVISTSVVHVTDEPAPKRSRKRQMPAASVDPSNESLI